MKKPFGLKASTARIINGFTETFGHCSDEEKVQLLSVLAQNSFGGDDSGSSSDESFGCRSQSISSDESSACGRAPQPNATLADEPTPCDPVSVADSTASMLMDVKGAEPPPLPDTQPTESLKSEQRTVKENGDQMEWMFTLYDFDGKGMVTREDIGSLVRSISEVLGNLTLPNCKADKVSSGKPVGAFKVKLSVVAESSPAPAKSPELQLFSSAKPASKRRSVALPQPNVMTQSLSQPIASATEQQHQKRPRKLSAPVLGHEHGVRRPKPCVQQASVSTKAVNPAPTNQHGAPNPRTKNCESCTYRDYVNLSELENCCTHHQAYPGVHHIRHCDRHCNCGLGRQPRCSGHKATHCEHVCTPDLYAELPPKEANRARNMAYFASRQKLLVEQSSNKENCAPSPPSTHFFAGSSLHERKHKHRQRQRQRAMEQVRQWIMRDAAMVSIEAPAAPLVDCKRASGNVVVEHKHTHEHHHYVHADA